jgi:hypothetical protein
MTIAELGVNALISIAILFSLLTAVFIFYVSGVVSAAVKDELGSQIRHSLAGVTLPDELRKQDVSFLVRYYSRPDPVMEMNNQWLFKVMTVVGALLVSFLIIILITARKEVRIGHLLIENFFIFVFVGAVELMFFKFVASDFIPTPPSLMVRSVMAGLNKYL